MKSYRRKRISEKFMPDVNQGYGYIDIYSINRNKIVREVNNAIEEAVSYIDSGDSCPTWHWRLGYDGRNNYELVLGCTEGFDLNDDEFTDSYGNHLALKWATISDISAMGEYDYDYIAPYDADTGDVIDTEELVYSYDMTSSVNDLIDDFIQYAEQINSENEFDESYFCKKSKRRLVIEDIEDDIKDEFMYAFLLDRMTVFNVNFYTLGNNKHPYFSTSAARFTRNKNDYAEGGQTQERLLYGKAKQFYEKWDHLHLSDLTDEEYDEIVSDIEDLKKAYPYYVAYEFDGKATRTSIPFYDIYKKSMEVPRRRR